MSIELVVNAKEPGMDRNLFLANGPYAIALDGFVYGGPWFVNRYGQGPVLNMNHHEDVDRLATRATCAQTLMVIRQGLFDMFRTEHGPTAKVFVNDCDEDVCLSWFLLHRHYMCAPTMNPMLNRLVAMEDALDATAGAYPFPVDLPALRSMAWIFEPYRRFRLSGQLDKKDSAAYRAIIRDVEHRIAQHIVGEGHELDLDTRYERVGGGKGWTMVREIGAQARTGMFADGIRAYVSVRERPDGRYAYTVGRMSPFIPFHLGLVYARLNAQEAILAGGVRIEMVMPSADPMTDRWSGSDMVGGSPRVSGSAITPDELTRVLADMPNT